MLLTVSGCISLTGFDLTQESAIGPLDLGVRACISELDRCPSGRSGIYPTPTPGVLVQPLVAFQVDAGFTLPASTRSGLEVSPSYSEAMTREDPPEAGRKWVGYIGRARDLPAPGSLLGDTFAIDRPAGSDGSPASREVLVEVVVGGRIVDANNPANRPVACDVSTVCIDSRGGIGSVKFRDLRLMQPATTTIAPGATATVPVEARYAGPSSPDINFALAASTTVPGSTATVNVPTLLPPQDSTSTVNVTVPIPPGTPPGAYAFTLTASVGPAASRETRSTTGSIVVTDAGGGPGAGGGAQSALNLVAQAPSGRRALRVPTVGFPVTITTNRPTTGTITLRQTRSVRVRTAGRTRLVRRSVVIARRTVRLAVPTTRVEFRSPALRPGQVRIIVAAEGIEVRTSTRLR